MEHRKSYAIIVVLTVCVFAGMLVINAAAAGAFGKTALFHNTTGDVSKFYYLEVTPAGWTFSIWGLIYLWQLLWLTYGLSTLCRSTSTSYLYVSPAHVPPMVYILFMFSCFCNVGWLVLWDRFYPEYALIVLVATALSLYAIEFFSCYQLHASTEILRCEEKTADVWLTRILLQNGIALYAGWVTVASLLNAAIVATYVGGLAQTLSSTLALSLLLTIVIGWFSFDVTKLDEYTRYTVAEYFPVILALVGSIAKNWDPASNNSVLSAFALVVVCVLTVARVIVMVVRHCKQPRNYTGVSVIHSSVSDYSKLLKSNDKSPVM